ncbi:hypothetical protein QTJ16_004391 [Diplocarpon rosae]|uniref:Cytochrome P450 monooxygenase n=1 Tax=Diplocarpon rosae TaxID=946125 RepID=A0AAD9SZU8_9HELO|nr:hypothetical protein QTJ16_004391 [Diplocarpon rosae]
MDSGFRLPMLLSAAAFLVVVSLVKFLLSRPKRLNLPVYPDSPFIIQSQLPLVVLPLSVIDEVRNLPEHKASFAQDVQKVMAYQQTGIGGDHPEMIQAIKVDLTRHIASTLESLQEEIVYGFNKEFGACDDWTSFKVYGNFTRLVALLSGRVFVGRPLCREEEWIQASIMYTFYAIEARNAVKAYPPYLRSFAAPFVPELKKLKKFRDRGAELLKPILDAHLSKEQDEKIRQDETNDEQGVMISWLLKHTPKDKRNDAAVLANNQMALSLGAIHTTTMAATAALYDLATYPEYIQPLREELEQVIAADGCDVDGDGTVRLKKSSMPKLWKLDSFLKESQRLTPPGLPSGQRVVTSPITLSTGLTLPKGTRFGFAAYAIHNSSTTPIFDPCKNPAGTRPVSEFDGLRFYKLRGIPGNEHKYQYVTTASDSLNFGHGNHACPGRFFASNEIKVILIELLRNWDFRFKGDVSGKGGVDKRPQNTYFDVTCKPDTQAEMEFRRRKQI